MTNRKPQQTQRIPSQLLAGISINRAVEEEDIIKKRGVRLQSYAYSA